MKLVRRLRRFFAPDPDSFLRSVRGVIHVGANVGQERKLYRRYGLEVLWIEPIPEVFATLTANIADLPRQRALERLVTDRDDASYEFHVANNDGGSSSILELKEPSRHLAQGKVRANDYAQELHARDADRTRENRRRSV